MPVDDDEYLLFLNNFELARKNAGINNLDKPPKRYDDVDAN